MVGNDNGRLARGQVVAGTDNLSAIDALEDELDPRPDRAGQARREAVDKLGSQRLERQHQRQRYIGKEQIQEPRRRQRNAADMSDQRPVCGTRHPRATRSKCEYYCQLLLETGSASAAIKNSSLLQEAIAMPRCDGNGDLFLKTDWPFAGGQTVGSHDAMFVLGMLETLTLDHGEQNRADWTGPD